ncbi:iron dicitrate transporter FecR [Bacteroidia bacterium]|nr:iron dicitrate transporter FecR [Bacteroidia bacterium]
MEKIKQILQKYIAGDINQKEYAALKKYTAQLSDEELKNVLSGIWEEYNEDAVFDGFDELVQKLRITPITLIPTQRRTQRWNTFLRMAASWAIPLALASTVYLYYNNRQLQTFLNKPITVNVKSGGKAEVTLPDSSTIYLNAATQLRYLSNFGKDKRAVSLNGEAYMKVKRDAEKPFCVDARWVQIEVLGTEFNIAAYENKDEIKTTLVSGSVKLTTLGKTPQTVVLEVNDKAVYNKQHDVLTIEKTDPHYEMAWMSGELVFRSAKFLEIIQTLQQRYGVDITIVGKKSSNDSFTGRFKEDNVYSVLKTLQLHYHFAYTMNTDNKIEILF